MALIQELYRPTLAMLPIGDRFTVNLREGCQAFQLYRAAKVIPLYYGTLPLLTRTRK